MVNLSVHRSNESPFRTVITLYNRLKENGSDQTQEPFVSRTIIMGGKAAPGITLLIVRTG